MGPMQSFPKKIRTHTGHGRCQVKVNVDSKSQSTEGNIWQSKENNNRQVNILFMKRIKGILPRIKHSALDDDYRGTEWKWTNGKEKQNHNIYINQAGHRRPHPLVSTHWEIIADTLQLVP